jgi:two-component system response regulator FixJ
MQIRISPMWTTAKALLTLSLPQADPWLLIAEDNEHVRHSLTRILKGAGYSVVEASNGKDVLQGLKRSADFCLLLTDIVMPEMEGLELITHLTRHHPKLPIIAMSGSFEGRFLDAARRLGAKETLQKPFERATLLAALESACA